MSAVKEIKSNKVNFYKTFFVSLIYLVVGLSMSILGPSLLDLQIAVNATINQISYLLPVRALGYVLGSLSGGFLPKKSNIQWFVILFTAATAVTVALLPWNRYIWTILMNAALSGYFLGILELCINVFLLHLWGKESPPFIQFLYFFYGLGSFAAPLIAEPFLLPVKYDKIGNITIKHHYTPSDLKIKWPYAMIAGYAFLVLAMFIIVYCLHKEYKMHPSLEKKEEQTREEKSSKIKMIFVVIITAIFMHLYFGNSIAFGGFLTTFAVRSTLKLSKSKGAFMTSVFWAVHALFRIPIIILMRVFCSRTLIIFELLLMLFSSIVLILFGARLEIALWIGTVVMGLGVSSVFALFLGYVQSYINLTNKILSIFLVSACFGEFLYPILIAKFIDVNPNIFIHCCVFCTLSSCFVFLILDLLGRKLK